MVPSSVTEPSSTPIAADPPRYGGYARPILAGLLIAAAGLVPWLLLAKLNATVRPDLPWAALLTLLYLVALLAWLNGTGPPRSTAGQRRQRLRLWPARPRDASGEFVLSNGTIVALLGLLYLLWIVVGRLSPTPDLTAFATTSYRWSLLLMYGLVAGIVEEAAFRGYMQTGLERHHPHNALWVTSLVFVAVRFTHGVGVILLAPGLFIVSMLYGMLARQTGTILPGMAIHVVGDLAYMYFGVLRGDSSLLFVA
jgi:membrane protease YdiL (CAAX protease family)